MRLLTFTEEVTNDKEVMKKLLSVGFEYVCQKAAGYSSENENK